MINACPVFSVADIDPSKLALLIEYSDVYERQFQSPHEYGTPFDELAFIDSKDLSTISGCSAFSEFRTPTTPFLEHTVQEVRDWFDVNIVLLQRKGFMHSCFLVLDERTNEDDTCLFVWTNEEAHEERIQTNGDPLCGTPDSPFLSLRCHFDMAMEVATLCDVGKEIEYGTMGSFRRSGTVMDKDCLNLVMNGGLYFGGGEVNLDQSWRDFRNW